MPDPPEAAERFDFKAGPLFTMRRFVRRQAATAGLSPERTDDLLLAVNEVVTNSVRYGDGHGELLAWHDSGTLICEVRDGGRIDDPLAGREYPATDQDRGRGLWVVNQLCDLVQLRSFESGTVVRLHIRSTSDPS